MSYFDEMIAREHIPDSYEHWAGYRQMVTDYIERNCPIKKKRRWKKTCPCALGHRAGRRYRYRQACSGL